MNKLFNEWWSKHRLDHIDSSRTGFHHGLAFAAWQAGWKQGWKDGWSDGNASGSVSKSLPVPE